MKTLAAADVRAAVAREWERFVAALPGTGDEGAWRVATRLPGWTVSDLAVHAVWGISMEADALRRSRSGLEEPADGRTLDPAAGPEAILAELTAARRALLEELAAVDDHAGDRIVPLPYGRLPLAMFLPILVMEAGIHADDLAALGGSDEPLADDVALATATFLLAFLPFLAAAATETPPDGTVVALRGATVDLRLHYSGGTWSAADAADLMSGPQVPGDPTTVIAAKDDSTILRFALGRPTPHHPGLDGAFKRWFPGP